MSDYDDDGSGFSAIDEDASDEAYFSRHAKHLETMRIEFEQKKKHLEELKEQKRLERLKHQSSSSGSRRR